MCTQFVRNIMDVSVQNNLHGWVLGWEAELDSLDLNAAIYSDIGWLFPLNYQNIYIEVISGIHQSDKSFQS